MKKTYLFLILLSSILLSLTSCKEYCTCTSFAPYQPEIQKEEYLLKRGHTCSEFEVTPQEDAGIRCE